MFDQLVERFCEFDDFCNAVRAEWKAMLLSNSKAADRQYGPEGGLADSEIMTVWICRKFRVRAITMEKKETSYGETEATGYFRRAA